MPCLAAQPAVPPAVPLQYPPCTCPGSRGGPHPRAHGAPALQQYSAVHMASIPDNVSSKTKGMHSVALGGSPAWHAARLGCAAGQHIRQHGSSHGTHPGPPASSPALLPSSPAPAASCCCCCRQPPAERLQPRRQAGRQACTAEHCDLPIQPGADQGRPATALAVAHSRATCAPPAAPQHLDAPPAASLQPPSAGLPEGRAAARRPWRLPRCAPPCSAPAGPS